MRISSSLSSPSVVQSDGFSGSRSAGACIHHSVSRSYASAIRSSVASSNRRPVSWKPIGSRGDDGVKPHGMLTAGSPARFALTVKTSARYICSGSDVRSPSLNGGRRARRHRDDVHALEGPVVVAQDQRPHLLRLHVVRVVVARAQHVRAEHDAPLDLGAEALLARPRVHRAQLALRVAEARSARRRSAPGSSSLRRSPRGSRRGWRTSRAAARCPPASRRAP